MAIEALLDRDIEDAERGMATVQLFYNQLGQGKLDACADLLQEPLLTPDMKVVMAYDASLYDVQVSQGELDEILVLPQDPKPSMSTFLIAARAADIGRPAELRRGIQVYREAAGAAIADGDSLGAQALEAIADALEGYATWREGNAGGAWPVLESAQKRVLWNRENAWVRWWLAELAAELGRPADAIRYLESLRGPLGSRALYPLARAYEAAGRRDDARRTYELLLIAWSEADAMMASQVAEIRQRLAGLGMAPRG